MPTPSTASRSDSERAGTIDPDKDAKNSRRVADVGVFVLLWICSAPLVWLCPALVANGQPQNALLLAITGAFSLLWNVLGMRPVLRHLARDPTDSDEIYTTGQKTLFFFVQFSVALVCKHLADDQNQEGMQQWFWMPAAASAVLVPKHRRMMAMLLLLNLLLATTHEYFHSGQHWALRWFLGQLTAVTFIATCVKSTKIAARQRVGMGRMALELKEANAELEQQAHDAAALAILQERNRLAREIHDAVGHSLTVVGAQLEAATAQFAHAPERALDAVRKAQKASQEGLVEIRRSVSALRVTSLVNHTLEEALRALIATTQHLGLKVTLETNGIPFVLPPLVESTLYRCAQESLTNACRHSRATEVKLTIDYTEASRVSLTISDNGHGFSRDFSEGYGLKGLRERASLLHGNFTIGTSPQGGGLCKMVIPA